MQADQALRRRMHGLGVQRLLDVPDPAPVQGRTTGPVEDAIQVFAPVGGEAGVPVVADRGAIQHRHRFMHQVGVQSVHHRPRRPVLVQIDMAGLARGVDPGIGAARSGDAHGLAGKGRHRRLDGALHRRLTRLGLKAVVS
ncbi:hypothetical protein D3C80_1152570 [compost metagenome]